jgi:periplasmic mercuric ion binding protein
MKTLFLYAVLCCSLFSANSTNAQTSLKKETIKVWGNCGMCKKTIEKSALSAGAKIANWNEETHQLKVTYAVGKTTPAKIQQAVAASGYDTQDFVADDKAYDNLHSCCQYERKEKVSVSTEPKACCSNAGCGKDVNACKDVATCKDQSCCKM